MYVGQTLFAQVMGFLPWKTFYRLVARYHGDLPRSQPVVRRAVPY